MPERENYDTSRTGLEKELGQSVNAGDASTPATPGEEVRRALGDIQATIRGQQLAAERELQSVLGQASAYIESSKRLDAMFGIVQKVSPLVASDDAIRSNNAQVLQALQQLSDLATTQQAKIAERLAQSLQEGISSMSQAHAAMFESQAFMQVQELVGAWKSNIRQVSPPSPPVQ
ncbi:MAG: hypothetical protein HPY55_12255 [Firmicutes bacterium]|nr:hypothetical protein [Bacillota bacterium]